MCVFVSLCWGFVSVTTWISFGMPTDPATVAVRVRLWVQSLCCLRCGQATSTVGVSCCWFMLLQGWLEGPEGDKQVQCRREEICHQATNTAGWSWQRPSSACWDLLLQFKQKYQRENTAPAYSIYAHIQTPIMHTLSDPQRSLKW